MVNSEPTEAARGAARLLELDKRLKQIDQTYPDPVAGSTSSVANSKAVELKRSELPQDLQSVQQTQTRIKTDES